MEMAAAVGVESLLRRLYESGEYSDLVIRTSTRDFKVHKCIVCSESGFFKGANRGSFVEAQTGIVKVQDSAEVMDILLKHVYGVPLEMVPREDDTEQALIGKAGLKSFQLALSVRMAADMYLISGLEEPTELIIGNCICRSCVRDGVSIGLELEQRFGQAEDCDSLYHAGNLAIRVWALAELAINHPEVAACDEAWHLLQSDDQYHRVIVKGSYCYQRQFHQANAEQAHIIALDAVFREVIDHFASGGGRHGLLQMAKNSKCAHPFGWSGSDRK